MKGSIGVATFSRADDLNRCLDSIVKARNGRALPLVVLHQQGHDEVTQVIKYWRSEIQVLLEVDALGTTPLQNININAILLRNLAFQELQADWFLGIEEDVVIGGDSITFIETMMNRYWKTPGFRGVNLGSAIPRSSGSEVNYSRIRYGLHGQAGAIPKGVWAHFETSRLLKGSNQIGLDAMLERYLKTGFMCWPNLSRYVDNGWNGTHTPKDSNNEYYENLRQSFIDLSSDIDFMYLENSVDNPWREDCFKYKKYSTPYHFIKNYALHILHAKIRAINLRLK
jgi:hypothetical protein